MPTPEKRVPVDHRPLLEARNKWTREELLAFQARSLAELREHVYANSPFYRRFHAGLEKAPLGELPVLTKSVVMDNFDELVTDRAVTLAGIEAHITASGGSGIGYLDRYVVSVTSGTTGRRGLFVVGDDEWELVRTSYRRSMWWAGLFDDLKEKPRLAFFSSPSPLHPSQQVTAAALASGNFDVLILEPSMSLGETVSRLNAFNPHYLAAYPSQARPLAEEQLAGRLRIAPKMLSLIGEVVTSEARARMDAAWGKISHLVYGTTETAALASECRLHVGMHLFEDLHIIELVDAEGRPVPPGTLGHRVLVTVLFRRTQPLIRYEVTDQVRLATEPCACGRPFARIEAIVGRVHEKMMFPSVDGTEIALDWVPFRIAMDPIAARQWQIVIGDDSLDVLLAGAGSEVRDDAVIDPLRRLLEERGVRVPEIRVVRVDEIPLPPSGKATQFRSTRTTKT